VFERWRDTPKNNYTSYNIVVRKMERHAGKYINHNIVVWKMEKYAEKLHQL